MLDNKELELYDWNITQFRYLFATYNNEINKILGEFVEIH